MFKAPFSFDGRIRRLEFGISYIIYTFFAFIIGFIDEFTHKKYSFIYILFVPMLWFLYAQGAKRCHDRGNTGWYQIIPFYVFWMLFGDGEKGENGYGLNPKGIENYDKINEIGKTIEE